MSLAELEGKVRHELDLTHYPRRDWVHQRHTREHAPIFNVAIVGAGQGGLATAFALQREHVGGVIVVDENPPGQEGPWRTFARMVTLRTPKHLTGPDLGLPSLTFRAWYEAQFGAPAYQELGLIPKEVWADYLLWLRQVLALPVQNNTRVDAVTWDAANNCWYLGLANGGPLYARKVVLATGIDGSGSWQKPEMVRALPAHRCAHTRDPIDFAALKGKRIGILGAGASAFDNAIVALEYGAASVDLFFRRAQLPHVNPYRWAEFTGFLKHHADLGDAARWRFILQILRMGQLPPRDTFVRATAHPLFRMHPESPWLRAEETEAGVNVLTAKGEDVFDFLILGSGFVTNLAMRPELRHVVGDIALWRDRYTPPMSEHHDDLARHPYLGPHFEFQEKVPGAAPYVQSIFNYTFGALLSMGFSGGSISGLKYSVQRLTHGITKQLYEDEAGRHFENLCAFDAPEFTL